MVERNMPRIQRVLFPVLRAEMPGVTFTSWIPDVDKRKYPLINVRRLGGITRHPDRLDKPVIELTCYSRDGLDGTEDLLLDARQVIKNMVDKQTITPLGYLHSYFETMGPTPFGGSFDDTWRVQMLIQLGLRPARKVL